MVLDNIIYVLTVSCEGKDTFIFGIVRTCTTKILLGAKA